MKTKIIIVVFTDKKLKYTTGLQRYAYYTTDMSISLGDHFESSRGGRWVQVVEIKNSENKTLNGKTLNNIERMENKTSMTSGIRDKYMSQFIPERVPNAKMSADGSICVLIGNEYVGMKGEELTSYPDEFVMDIPVYSISKPQSKVKPGEIVISGKGSFGKVLEINSDGSLKILSFSGYTHNKKEVKDFMLGQATVRVLVNIFDTYDDFNPLFFAMASGDDFDLKTLAMMQMMPGAKKFNSPMSDLMSNPMMAMMMMKSKDSESNNCLLLLETMMLMNMRETRSSQDTSTAQIKSPSSPTTNDIMKDLLADDPEFQAAFVKAMKKRSSKEGGEE